MSVAGLLRVEVGIVAVNLWIHKWRPLTVLGNSTGILNGVVYIEGMGCE